MLYDRVIPAEFDSDLVGVGRWGIVGGDLLNLASVSPVFICRILLANVADLKISDRVFGHALRIKNKDRPKSTGTFISQFENWKAYGNW